ncbi:MAG: hypothetical protein QXT68_08125 [Halobacteria archaeon]
MAQVKLTLPDDLAKKLRQIAIAKHGTLNLKAEGEEAIRIYVQRNARWLKFPEARAGSLRDIIGSVRSRGRRDALHDKKALYDEA